MGVLFNAMKDGLNPKKVASTKGGEYHSACPSCGGKDRFIIWDKLNRYFCRQCRKTGDEVQYIRDFHGLSYVEACRKVGIVLREKPASKEATRHIFQFKPKIAQPPPLEWREQAKAFTLYCQEQLRKDLFALGLLYKRGFSQQTIEKFQLGWNPNSLWLNRSQWGLEPEKKLWIPKGLLIPTFGFSNAEPLKLKIRRSDWHEGDKLPKYVEISGSMQIPGLYGYAEGKPIVVVESELDAILLQQCAGDLCCCMALGGVSKRPDAESHELLLKAPTILFSLDVDVAGALAYRWWNQVYPNIRLWPPPVGKSPGDACLAGIDLREWMSQGLSVMGSHNIQWN